MRVVKWAFLGLVLVVVTVVAIAFGLFEQKQSTTAAQQDALAAFYQPPSPVPSELGTVVRMEPLGVTVPGGTGFRMLYVSQRPNGEPAVSGGMLFIPSTPAPPQGRPVVAWAHGTLGMGDACTPSRSTNPLQDTDNWLGEMMNLGWVVVSTDYVGMGTPGPNLYLVAQAEARDVVNSVRAARNVPEAHAGKRFVAWGHSQGGHSSIWTGHLARTLAPELELIAVAAAAPAAELNLIIGAQWPTPVGWVIGPEVEQSWPVVYPDLPLEGVITARGLANSERLANECIVVAGIEGLARTDLGQDYFVADPVTNTAWAAVGREQTPSPLPSDMPVLITQSTADAVVLAWPNGVLQDTWCAAGSALSMLWLGKVSHQDTAMVAGPQVVSWIADRFAGRPAGRTCDVPPPVRAPVTSG
jgi:hypothetical protein